MPMTIAITAPTGNVASKLGGYYRQAQAHDIEVVVLARKAQTVRAWAQAGARVFAGRLEDRDYLVNATRGVDALFWVTPNSFPPGVSLRRGYRQFAESAAHAIRTNGIKHTIHLSGFAHVDDGGGENSLFGALADTEAILDEAVEEMQLGITHLRSGFMFENLLGQLNDIRDKHRFYLPVNMKRRIPMVASQDVTAKVAEALLTGPPRGKEVRGVWGPEDISFGQVASALSAGLGHRIRLFRLPRAVIRFQMLRIGRDPRMTDALMSAFAAISKGKVTADPARDASSTTPTTMTQWAARVLKPIIEGNVGEVCPARVQYEPPQSSPGSPVPARPCP
jgi:uncharacterized protein YbjT (DUF2867 family)